MKKKTKKKNKREMSLEPYLLKIFIILMRLQGKIKKDNLLDLRRLLSSCTFDIFQLHDIICLFFMTKINFL